MERTSRPSSSAISLAAVLVLAGLLFTTSAQTARGTSLRPEGNDAAALEEAQQGRLAAAQQRVQALNDTVQKLTAERGTTDVSVAAVQRQINALAPSAGLHAVSGAGYQVTLNDAPSNGTIPDGVRPDDLVVHQQDVQAVVNALWAGGATAMMLMDQRVIATSAVRCVGNTLILQGRVYSPPYTITALGDPASLERALATSPEVSIYREYVAQLGLQYGHKPLNGATLPAYQGAVTMQYATVKR